MGGVTDGGRFGPSSQWAEMRDGYGSVAAFVQSGYLEAPDPVPTCLAPLDELTGGLRPGLSVLGGEPGAGKSALALQMCAMTAFRGVGALYVSLEMSFSQCMARVLSWLSASFPGEGGMSPFEWSRAHLGAEKARGAIAEAVRTGEVPACMERLSTGGDAVITAARVLGERMPGLMVCSAREAAEVRGLVEIAGRACGLGASLVVVDYVQLVDAPGQTEYERVGAVSAALNALGNSAQVPIFALSSLSREGAKTPGMHGYRGSGQVEYDANMALVLTRDAGMPGSVSLHVVKNRHGPSGGEPIALGFDGAHSRFTWGRARGG